MAFHTGRPEGQDLTLALGAILEQAAYLERDLLRVFCALVGSKFAVIVGSGQNTSWLIENCRALTEAHLELPESSRQSIRTALAACSAANQARNVLVHSSFLGDQEPYAAVKDKRHSVDPSMSVWTLDEIRAVSKALRAAGNQLRAAAQDALGRMVVMELHSELLWEGHERSRAAD